MKPIAAVPRSARPEGAGGRLRGAILLVTMWILFFLAALVLVFARSARTALLTFANQAAAVQASAVERSAEQYVLALVDQQKDSVLTLAESSFAGIAVGGGFFWILRPDFGDDSLPFFGLLDESSKVNLNSATADMLQCLPGMTADLAASIVDWRDGDSEAEAGGAEDEYYLALPQPYRPKNAPLETVEEVLLIKGMTSEHLYGTGVGSRYGGDPTWGTGIGTTIMTDLQLARGIFDNLTIYSAEPESGESSQQKVNVNDENPMPLSQLLKEVLGGSRAEEIAGRVRSRSSFKDIFDFAVRAGLSASEFDSLAGRITTGASPGSTGLINIYTAPQEVLLCLPGLTDGDVASLLSQRLSAQSSGGISGSSTASGSTSGSTGAFGSGLGWVLEALGSKSVGLYNLITTRSYQYSADILAASVDGRAFSRTRIVVDSRTSPPKVVYRRDLTEIGWPLDPAILLSLREGLGVPAAYASTAGGL